MKTNVLTEKQVVRALRRLNRGWPPDLWLFSANGTLCLMRKGPDGDQAMTPSGGVDPDYEVDSFYGIENSGGDW